MTDHYNPALLLSPDDSVQGEAPMPSGPASDAPGDPGANLGPDGQPRRRRRRRRRRGGRGGPGAEGSGGPQAEGQAVGSMVEDDDGDDDEAPGHAPGMEGDEEVEDAAAPSARSDRPAAPVPAAKVNDVFQMTQTFADLGLRNSVLKGVADMGFVHPTKVQADLIPVVLQGRDVLGQAKTGSGKTAAFGLPLFHLATRGLPFQSVILVPTRELAQQVANELIEMGRHTPIKVSAVFGGESIRSQSASLEQNPEIVVATPGRLMDLLERGRLHLNNVRFAVLDEVDRMLDIGFRDDIRKILGGVKHEHRTIFVSATISDEIETLARKYMRDPVKLVTVAGSLTVSMVEQHYLPVQPWDKRRLLHHLLTHEEPDLTVIFCRTKRTVDDIAEFLRRQNIDVQAIHGDMQQSKRNRVMTNLRGGKLAVLVASDLAARGLDVENISHVINYDLPEDPEVYIHRIGRTARAGRKGVAWSFVTTEQGELLTAIEKLANIEIPKMEYPDFQPSPPREDRGPSHGGGGHGGGRRDDRRGGPPRGDRGDRGGDRGPAPDRGHDRGPDRAPAGGGDHQPYGGGPHSGAPYGGAPQPPAPAPAKPPAPSRTGPTLPRVNAEKGPNPTRFPGGVVPTKLPPKMLGGRVKTSRSSRGQGPED